MAEPRHLGRAPIKEAVVDFRCQTKARVDSEFIKKVRIAIGYMGASEDMRRTSFEFVQTPGAPPTQQSKDLGFVGGRFFSEDKKYVVQMRNDGMTFSRLEPYTDWTIVFGEAARLWTIYNTQFEVAEVSRIAVRYINRLLLPNPEFSENPQHFLTPPPSQPIGAQGDIVQWLTRFVLGRLPDGLNAIVTQMSDAKVESPDRYAMIFDIDVFTSEGLSPDIGVLSNRFSLLRDLKNRVFFSGLTERALELFA